MAKSLAVKKLQLPQLLLMSALCLAAYAPTLNLPLMEDDYPNIAQALTFGSASAPFADPIFRMRATSYWAMRALHGAFDMSPAAYHTASLALAYREYVADLLRAARLAANAIGRHLGGGLFRGSRGPPGSRDVVFGHQRVAAILFRRAGVVALDARAAVARPQFDLLCAGAGFEGVGGGIRGAFRFRADGQGKSMPSLDSRALCRARGLGGGLGGGDPRIFLPFRRWQLLSCVPRSGSRGLADSRG